MANPVLAAFFQRVAMDMVRTMDAERVAEFCDYHRSAGDHDLFGMASRVFAFGNVFNAGGQGVRRGVAEKVWTRHSHGARELSDANYNYVAPNGAGGWSHGKIS